MSFTTGYARKLGMLEYKGTWNASTNVPNLQSGQGQKNGYYVVSNPGSTNLDGISDWNIKDWLIFNGSTWEKIDNSEESQVIDSLSGDEASKAPSVSSVKNSLSVKADKNFGFAQEVHVAKNGVDAGSIGKPYQPFLTLSSAISYVENTFTSGEQVVIFIHPGSYLESITITRPRTHLIGIQQTNALVCQVGSVTLSPTLTLGGVYNSTFSIEGLLISATSSSSACLNVSGSTEFSLHMRNVYMYVDGAEQKALIVTNTASTKPRLYLNDVLINNTLSSSVAIDLSNTVAQIKNTTIYSGAGACLKINNTASALLGFCLLETSGSLAVDLAATTLTLSVSSITASGSNASGVAIAAGGTYTSIQNFYNVTNGSGYAITGFAGAVVTHASNTFAYGSNNKYKNVLTLISHASTMVSSN